MPFTPLTEDECDVIFESVACNFNQQKKDHRIDMIEESDDCLLSENNLSSQSSVKPFLITRLMKWVTVLGGLMLVYFAYLYLSAHGWCFRYPRKKRILSAFGKGFL